MLYSPIQLNVPSALNYNIGDQFCKYYLDGYVRKNDKDIVKFDI